MNRAKAERGACTHREIIVGEEEQLSQRVFLHIVGQLSDHRLVVERIDQLRLLLLEKTKQNTEAND